MQAVSATLFLLMAQLGETVRAAYQIMVDMMVIVTFIPFVVHFRRRIPIRQPDCGGVRTRRDVGRDCIIGAYPRPKWHLLPLRAGATPTMQIAITVTASPDTAIRLAIGIPAPKMYANGMNVTITIMSTMCSRPDGLA